MVITVPIECPMCGIETDHLAFWKEHDNRYYHVCTECKPRPKSESELLQIGYKHGYQSAIEAMKNRLENLK